MVNQSSRSSKTRNETKVLVKQRRWETEDAKNLRAVIRKSLKKHNYLGMVWYGMVWYGMVWYGMVWYGMVWCNMVWYTLLTFQKRANLI